MANVTRRRTGEFLRELFGILMRQPDGLRAGEAVQAVAARVRLTEWENGQFKTGWRFDKILRWATVDCVKAGWMLKNKGQWFITDEGVKAYNTYTDPEAFCRKAVELYREWKAAQNDAVGRDEPDDEEVEVDKDVSVTFEAAEEQSWNEIAAYLQAMPPYEFQELVGSLLRAMNYHVAWIAPPGKDGGVDIMAWNDPLGTRPPRIKVQVKRQAQRVPVDGLRSFMAILGDDEVGLFVSMGGFTKDAEDEARSQGRRKVTLLDLDKLFDLWVQYYDKLDEPSKRRSPLRPIYFLAPEG